MRHAHFGAPRTGGTSWQSNCTNVPTTGDTRPCNWRSSWNGPTPPWRTLVLRWTKVMTPRHGTWRGRPTKPSAPSGMPSRRCVASSRPPNNWTTRRHRVDTGHRGIGRRHHCPRRDGERHAGLGRHRRRRRDRFPHRRLPGRRERLRDECRRRGGRAASATSPTSSTFVGPTTPRDRWRCERRSSRHAHTSTRSASA